MTAPTSPPNQHAVSHGKGGEDVVPSALSRPLFKQTLTVAPSATINTNGTLGTMPPDTGFSCIYPVLGFGIYAQGVAISAETLTLLIAFNYSDSTAATASFSLTVTGTIVTLGTAVGAGLIKDGVTITSITATVQSSKASSTASATLTIVGESGL